MAIVLSLETSTTVTSAALHENGKLLVGRELHLKQAAAAQLTILIDQLFTSSGIGRTQLDAVAVSGGPGSYTGLRIGTATAKGICYSLDRPLIALDSLHVLASSIPLQHDGRLLCPMIDARRMEVFTILYDINLTERSSAQSMILETNSFSSLLLSDKILFCGGGSKKLQNIISYDNAIFNFNDYTAKHLAQLSYNCFLKSEFSNLAYTAPLYIKEFYTLPQDLVKKSVI